MNKKIILQGEGEGEGMILFTSISIFLIGIGYGLIYNKPEAIFGGIIMGSIIGLIFLGLTLKIVDKEESKN